MRKELTRTKQALDKETVRKIIETTAYGVLSLNGDDGYLYTVPLSYVYTLSENEQNQLFYRRTEPSRSKCPRK